MAKTKTESDPSKKKSKKKKTKNLLSAPAAAAMKSTKQQRQPTKANPFEIMWSRKKFDILGKKRKGEERRSGLARSQAIEKRKKTLQQEYEQSTKSSVFVDKRIGEKDDTLQEFNKAVLRLQRERQLKLRKGSKYNLDDVDENDSRSHQIFVDDFDEDVPLDDDEDTVYGDHYGSTSSKYLNLHEEHVPAETNSVGGTENVHKTKKQVMSEIMWKSKSYKAQKVKDKEEDDHLMKRLDQDFTSLAHNEALLSLIEPKKMNALNALANKGSTSQSSKEILSSSADKESILKEKPDAYDKLVKEMSMDMRARPSDRTKTPEEIAQEERERLEALEAERRKRMVATDASEDDDSSDGEDHNLGSEKSNAVSGDDLGDSFSADMKTVNRTAWVDDIYEKEDAGNQGKVNTSSDGSGSGGDDEEGSDDEDDTDDDGDHTTGDQIGNMSSIKDWEQSDDDELDLDPEQVDEDDAAEPVRTNRDIKITESNKSSSAGKQASRKLEPLPFVIDAPKSYEELCKLFDGRSDEEVVEAINRIRTCNAIRLSPGPNRRKLQMFYGFLFKYFAILSSERPLNVRRVNSLVKPLIEISTEVPYYSSLYARERLEGMRKRFCERIRIPGVSSWPSLTALLRFRLWSLIFPCSDFRHPVMTPAILLMCQFLMRCPIVSGQDIAVGSFLCSMLLAVTKQSQKFCPEPIFFLQTLLMSSFESEPKLQQNSQCHHVMELRTLKPWLVLRDQISEVNPIDFFMVMDLEVDSPFFLSDKFKASILLTVVETLKEFVIIYEKLSSFSEIFLPISDLLHEVLQKANLPSLLQGNVRDVIDMIRTKVGEHLVLRQPLQMRKQKPAPIKLLNPKFEESFVKGRDYDPDRERAERKKLKKLLKREAKGAIRELRKDNHFIFGLKERDKLLQDEERAEKYGKARAFLQEQENAFKSGQLGKGRKRRR